MSTASAPSAPREIVLASWIHVSDLHFGHGDPAHQWNQKRVLAEILVDAQALVQKLAVPRPGLIFVTGDIAFSGGARPTVTGEAEYTLASQWLGQLQKVLEIPSERVFMVPGNHDVDRKADVEVRRLLKLARAGEESIDEILEGPNDRDRLRGRMARYLAFADSYGPPATDRYHGGLWWRQRVELAQGVSLRICGLNTALLSVDDQDQGKLRVGQRQLFELFEPAPGELELEVVLGHHPPTGRWLADQKELRDQLDRHTAIHLFGHVHEAETEQSNHGWGPGGLRITAGAAHMEAAAVGSPPVGHGYNFGALVVLGSGDLVVRIWPRRWSTRSPRFVADVDITLDQRGHAEYFLPAKYRIHRPSPTPGLQPGEVSEDAQTRVAKPPRPSTPQRAEGRQAPPSPGPVSGPGIGTVIAPVGAVIEVKRPHSTAVGHVPPSAGSRPSGRMMMLLGGGVLLAGLVSYGLLEVSVDNGPDGNDGTKTESTVSSAGTDVEPPKPVTKPAPVVVEPSPKPITCERDDEKPEGTTCVPRCPDGMKFIKGTGDYDFTAEGERRNIDAFCLDTMEVTVAAFRSKASAESYAKSKRSEDSQWDKYCNARREDREDHPMNCVDWTQASAHCESVGGRLPTEWEWEWVARGREEGRAYPWGSEKPDCKRAIFSPGSVDGCGKDRTWAVGSVSPAGDSRDGLKDMSGNVWEWTSSINGENTGNDSLRVLRGGGWFNVDAGILRASFRYRYSPTSRFVTGFRCARTAL